MNLAAFLQSEWRELIANATRPIQQQPAPEPMEEGKLIAAASEGAVVRGFLESEQVQAFMARAEANMTSAMLSLPLDDDTGRRNLAVAIQSHRQMLQYLIRLAADGRAAESALQRLAAGPQKQYF